jgi:copper chaperone CopZ
MKALQLLTLIIIMSLTYNQAVSAQGSMSIGAKEKQAEKVKTETVELDISGMHCGVCANRLSVALSKVEGVIDNEVSIDTEKANIEFDPSKVTVEKLIETVSETGFEGKLAKAEDAGGK